MATQTEVIVLEYQARIDGLEKGLNKIEAEQKQIAASSKASMGAIEKGAKQAANATDQVSKNTTELKGKLSDLANNLPFANQIQQVTQLGGAITGLGGAAQKSSSGFQVLKLAIASTGIGALVIAIIALIAYFKRTDDGATKLSGIMSGLGAAADLVTGYIVGLGDALFTALSSVDGFREGLSNLGDFIVQNLINRFNGLIGILEATGLALQGQFAAAGKKALDSVIAINTGVANATDKIAAFSEQAAAAAKAAYEWEQAMDSLEDKIREDSVAIAQNDAAITKLIIASKNKTTQDEKALANLDEATKLEKQNLKITLENEEAKLRLLQERNTRERESINQDKKNLTDELKREETTAKRKLEILKELRSINDNYAQEEVAQQVKIIQIRQASDNLLEKVQNRRDAKEEEIFQNQVKRIAQEEILRENAAKQQYLDGVINAQEFEDELYKIKLEGLNNQKELLISDSRDIVEIDKAILDLELSNLDKNNKAKEASLKEFRDAEAKYDKEQADAKAKRDKQANDEFLKMVEERLKEEEEKVKEYQDKINSIRQAGFQIADTLASGFANISAQKRQTELDEELKKSQTQTEQRAALLQQQLDNGIISQEQFNARKAAIDKKQADKEADIKKKQFQANKKAALIQIAIDTALAVAKTIASVGLPAGLLLSALAIAQGAAQAAIVSAQPTPKFKKGVIGLNGPGTGTSDSIPALLSKGESVMTADETDQHRGALEAMRARRYDQYVKERYVMPAVERMQRDALSRRESKEKEVMRRFEMVANNNVDMSNTNRLIKKNNTVNMGNTTDMAKAIAKELSYNNQWFR